MKASKRLASTLSLFSRRGYHFVMRADIALSILRRLIEQGQGGIPSAAAEAILQLEFADADRSRMNDLADKSNQGTLTHEEDDEYDGYIAVADLLSLWKSKARLALRHHPSAA